MKHALFIGAFLLLDLPDSYSQLNQRFYASGNAPNSSDLGANSSYIFIGWRDVQKNITGNFKWTSLDADVQSYQQKGIDPVIVIACVNPLPTLATHCDTVYNENTNGGQVKSWFPVNTVKWQKFIDSLVDRYDGANGHDMPGLVKPVTQWHIEQEWRKCWCSNQYADTSMSFAQEFSNYVNMTYTSIKNRQSSAKVSYAGIDVRHDKLVFHDGYSSTPLFNWNINCNNPVSLTAAQVEQIPSYNFDRKQVLYLLKNTQADEIDVHQYGRWKEIPYVYQWLKDSASLGNKSLIFYEGGGPFCSAGDSVYHKSSNQTGILPAQLVRDNASYVVYYFMTGLASGIKKLNWHIGQEYGLWGAEFGDLDMLSIGYVRKPSYFTYRFLAKDIFSNVNADTVVKIAESNPSLYHYRINPIGIDVVWSTNSTDSYTLTGNGTGKRWDIPQACDTYTPSYCDSVVQISPLILTGSNILSLTNSVPVFYALPPFLSISAGRTICMGESTMLTVSGASSYSWLPSGSLNSDSLYDPVATPSATTTYTVTGTNLNGVNSSQTVTIIVDPLPVIYVADKTICEGDSTTLSASGANSYTWDPGNLTGANHDVGPSTSVSYTVVGTDINGCINSLIADVTVSPLPTANFGFIKGATTTISDSSKGDVVSWFWDFDDPGSGSDTSIFQNPTHNFALDVSYSVCLTVTSSNACTDRICKQYGSVGINESSWTNFITIFPNPNSGSFTFEAEFERSEKIRIDIGNALGDIVFSFSDQNTSKKFTKNIDLIGLPEGLYFLFLKTEHGNAVKKIVRM